MQPTRFEVVGDFLAIVWADGEESVIDLQTLRRNCPCARCAGESDLTGHVHRGPSTPLRPESFQVVSFERVGNYAVAPRWADGHDTGIYTLDSLRRLGSGQA